MPTWTFTEMPYAWGLQNVDIRQERWVGVGINHSLKSRHMSVMQANAIIAPDIRKQGKMLVSGFSISWFKSSSLAASKNGIVVDCLSLFHS